ncbi:unnamed protein product [Hermetia illucens]|uniref:Serine protease HTRA2, mitochondrial n=1 Tax=Hermetia illucens TaxID=343691 RepID=A0A7R8YTQ5_HERIL|nr:serine protease HTRA2, mitochondrial-like [Hermetia illucens]CAD7085007.1 unnamed protein product [Hermetia illucens]
MALKFLHNFNTVLRKFQSQHLARATALCPREFHHRQYKQKQEGRSQWERDYSQNGQGFSDYKMKVVPGFLIGAICGYTLSHYSMDPGRNPFLISEVKAATTKTLSHLRTKFNFIADVVEVSAPSVVYIEIKDTRRFDYYSGQPFMASNGSGFIVASDGLILTNAHVVINKPNTIVQVKLMDGRTFPGVVEDVDQTSDLATVRIHCNDLPAMKLGESASLKAGEWVVALGSPLALSNTVTAGVVSSTQRPSQELGLRGRDINYIQTDAAITFGNSGGPLVNLDGEAIGINSMKVTAGISFAIPIDYAKEFLARSEERRKKGTTRDGKPLLRRYMGITMLTLTPDILHELKQRSQSVPENVEHGVLVWKVIIGSPAHAGGLNPGDIVTHINGKEVKNSSDIYDALAEKGKVLDMTVYRGLKQLRIIVKPDES